MREREIDKKAKKIKIHRENRMEPKFFSVRTIASGSDDLADPLLLTASRTEPAEKVLNPPEHPESNFCWRF